MCGDCTRQLDRLRQIFFFNAVQSFAIIVHQMSLFGLFIRWLFSSFTLQFLYCCLPPRDAFAKWNVFFCFAIRFKRRKKYIFLVCLTVESIENKICKQTVAIYSSNPNTLRCLFSFLLESFVSWWFFFTLLLLFARIIIYALFVDFHFVSFKVIKFND